MNEPEFLKVKPGDAVLVGEDEIEKAFSFVGGVRDPDAPALFKLQTLIQAKSNMFMVRK